MKIGLVDPEIIGLQGIIKKKEINASRLKYNSLPGRCAGRANKAQTVQLVLVLFVRCCE